MTDRYVPDLKVPLPNRVEAPRADLRCIGKSMKRVEDPKLLTGSGKYIGDVTLPDMAHVALLRSQFAHARIKSIDVSRARELPGIIAVVTGKELAETTGPTISFAAPPVTQHVIAVDRVRHVGEAVVAVVGENRYVAEDALDLIDVEYEQLPIVSDLEQACNASGDAVLHPERGETNVAEDINFCFGPVEDDFKRADIVVKRKIRWHRSGGMPMETAGAVAEFNPGTGKFTIYCNTGMLNFAVWFCAQSLGVPSTHVNLVPVLVGGSYGTKALLHKPIVLTAALSRLVGRPVKYIEDRLDHFVNSDAHASDRIYDAELALSSNGTMLSLRFHVVDDYGAYLQFGIGSNCGALAQITGPYRINSVGGRVVAVLTNKCQQSAYRGYGAEVSNFVLERLVDAAARELNLDPVEIRRRNLIQPDEFPYVIPTGNAYDSGNYPAVLKRALEMFDYEGWRAKQASAREHGRYIGIGLVACQERSVYSATEFWALNSPKAPSFQSSSSPESVFLKIDPAGKVFVKLNAPFWGQSPETVATQVIAEILTVSPGDVAVSYADLNSGFNSTGPGGSRYTTMVTGALVKAGRLLAKKLFRLAGHILQCNESVLELRNGRVGIKDNPEKEISIAEIAMQSHYFRLNFPDDPEFVSGLETTAVYDHPLTTLPAADRSHLGIFYPMMGHAVHAVAVEVNPHTGKVNFLDYVAVHDCGTLINPMTMDGQIRGGVAQGVGTALYEAFRYDEEGQLLTASFADYHIPTALEIPCDIRIGHVETPSPYTEFGVKGGGEGGRMAGPPAIVQAVEDALSPFGAEFMEVPLVPSRVRQVLRESAQATEVAT